MTMPKPATTAPEAAAPEHVVQEMLACWQTGCSVYAAYLAALGSARTPEAVVAANAEFLASSLGLATSATGAMLRQGGLKTPLLNDA
jgi:hypothetical protein